MKKNYFFSFIFLCAAQLLFGQDAPVPEAILNNARDAEVVINELMADNDNYVQDEGGDYDDWFELFNNSDVDVDLGGYFLTDNPENLAKFEIPQGTIISAGGYFIFWADEDDDQGPYHCNFKLSADGEVLFLLDPGLNFVDSVTFGPQQTDMSYARVPNGTGNFIIQLPTFNASNTSIGVNEIKSGHHTLEVYPVPANDFLTILVPDISPDQSLEIRNLAGQVVHMSQAQHEQKISVASWPSGIYIIRTGNQAQKILVRH